MARYFMVCPQDNVELEQMLAYDMHQCPTCRGVVRSIDIYLKWGGLLRGK